MEKGKSCCNKFDESMASGVIQIMNGQHYLIEETPPVAYVIGSCPFCSKQIVIENSIGYTGNNN